MSLPLVLGRTGTILTRDTCRVCQSRIDAVLSLGEQYVSNFLLPEQGDGLRAPLELALCANCGLLQLRHTVSAEAM
jgi:NDP-4-keto-2,6-dideoxyhexose 3-C-methyltransferase